MNPRSTTIANPASNTAGITRVMGAQGACLFSNLLIAFTSLTASQQHRLPSAASKGIFSVYPSNFKLA
ncbi:MAG: hypothetical protein LBM04_01685 [Opitutaceae bacterium]|jgi:hypothetical protein|nr:hypothetical protein [Opitutaceae bacterium]